MIWDTKYRPREPVIICPVCNNLLVRNEWEDFGMHLHCTEYFISGRCENDVKRAKNNKVGKR